jgi:hypothetical protein
MARSTKLADLMVKETSGVDHPAHLHEGWLVMKSQDLSDTLEELTNVNKETNMDLEVTEHETPEVAKSSDTEDIRKELFDLRKQLDDARNETNLLKSVRLLEKATESAHAWSVLPELNPVEFAPVLCALREELPLEALIIEKVLEASSVALRESGLLKELGTTAPAGDNDAWSQISAQANQMVADGSAPSFAKAVTVIATTNKSLYNQYVNEKGI